MLRGLADVLCHCLLPWNGNGSRESFLLTGCCPHLQNGQEVSLGRHRADELTLGPVWSRFSWKISLGCEEEGIWMLNQPECLLLPLQMAHGKVVIYLNFNKAFGITLEDIFVSCVGLSAWTIKQSSGINLGI